MSPFCRQPRNLQLLRRPTRRTSSSPFHRRRLRVLLGLLDALLHPVCQFLLGEEKEAIGGGFDDVRLICMWGEGVGFVFCKRGEDCLSTTDG